jgi:hypothetical protein
MQPGKKQFLHPFRPGWGKIGADYCPSVFPDMEIKDVKALSLKLPAALKAFSEHLVNGSPVAVSIPSTRTPRKGVSGGGLPEYRKTASGPSPTLTRLRFRIEADDR